jgi:hypothetical protein
LKLAYRKRVSAEDAAEALKGKVPSNRITVEEDGDEVRVLIPDDVALTDSDVAALDDSFRMLRRGKR